jgi:hypothetical protein
MATTVSKDSGQFPRKYSWTGLTANDNGDAVKLGDGWGLVSCIQVFSGGGTGFNSGTVTIQVSNDGTNWATAKDIHGNDCTATAGALFELSVSAGYIRPSMDASISDVDVIFKVA